MLKLSQIARRLIVLFCVFTAVSSVMGTAAQLEGLYKVASNNCGNINAQPNLLMGSTWTYPPDAIPETVVSMDDPARTVAFGETVVFSFNGLKPNRSYFLAFRILSDDALRVQSIGVDDTVLEEKLTLPKAQVVERIYQLDKSVYADGTIQVTVRRLAGPNAVVSTLDVYSDDLMPLKQIELKSDFVFKGGLSQPSVNNKGRPVNIQLLNGVWKFNTAVAADFWEKPEVVPEWSDIEVPGEWVMQGYDVVPNTAAGYVRTFEIPKRWLGKRIKLRFDAVFSIANVYVNGSAVGSHEGGFTPFELDITEQVKFGGKNTLAVSVVSESLSDILSSASQYAVHPLGGITRKVTLFAVPEVNVKSYHITTEFDEAYDNAIMYVSMKVNNQTGEELQGAKLKFSLMKWPTREPVAIKSKDYELKGISAGQVLSEQVKMAVDSPDKWDNEHPNLYVLQCQLKKGLKPLQTVEKRFGFRQVEVRGHELFVNGHPVKLRGINRHEVHPKRGRSLTMQQWQEDVELFREANCNLIRTSHYPPAEEFIDLCDEKGLFVEEEAALCWIGHHANKNWKEWNPQSFLYQERIVRNAIEMIERDRSHPSILFWSLANESAWTSNFKISYNTAREYDSSRPFTFHDQASGSFNNYGSSTEIANHHYPGPNGPKNFANSDRPVWFGEYCHLNAYNRYELWTDPGVRDAWGRGLKSMWDNMYATPSILGGAIWSGVDDTFYLTSGHTVGYGTWGPIDGWRRRKPEYWHIKKVYSPVRINIDHVEVSTDGKTITIPLENRHNFSNISELDINWQIDNEKGKTTADILPRANGKMLIHTKLPHLDGKTVYLRFNSPLGFLVDEYRLPIGKPIQLEKVAADSGKSEIIVESKDDIILVNVKDMIVKFDISKGMIAEVIKADNRIFSGGPELMVIPLNGEGDTQMTKQMKPISSDTKVCSGRTIEDVSYAQDANAVSIVVSDRYDKAKGGYKLIIGSDGSIKIDYSYEMIADVNPRQYGMVLSYPIDYDKLDWKRKGLWTTYPDDHIARLEGTAEAFVGVELSGIAGPASPPEYSWRHDTNGLGTNDFRSTKENIIEAYLSSSKARGPVVESDGNQHVRCWMEGDVTRMLIAEYNNPGSERFFRGHASREDRALQTGQKIRGFITFRLN